MVKCSTCGYEAEESYFCPNCGSKIIQTDVSTQENNTYETDKQSSNDIPEFNNSESEKDIVDNIIDFDDKISGKMANLMSKSKVMNTILDKTASYQYKNIDKMVNNSTDRKYFEKIEPVFLEVLDSIDDNYVKSILVYERSMMGSTSSVVGTVASQVYTPTKDMPHDEAIAFYQDMVNKIVDEINEEKQKGTFDEEKFYKRKLKQSSLNNTSVLGISNGLKAFKRNRK